MLRTILPCVALLLAACSPREVAPTARDLSMEADLARGGRLYDKWFAEAELTEPTAPHSAYPADAAYAAKPGANWRCKECHGWDYAGKDGAYASGKHATGIAGVLTRSGANADEIISILRDETHGFGEVLGADDLRTLATFVAAGTMDMDGVIDRASAEAQGDVARGRVYYKTICAGCHGSDGKAEEMPVLGAVSRKNPWETLHKILNGQPATEMPALRALDLSVSVDVLTYVQTLPAE